MNAMVPRCVPLPQLPRASKCAPRSRAFEEQFVSLVTAPEVLLGAREAAHD